MSRSSQEEIYLQIRGQFKAAEKCADKVKELIADYYPNFSKLNRTTLLMIMKMIRKDFKREEWPDVKYMFKSIFVYILADHKPHLFMKDVAELLDVYPEFSDADEVEKSLLLQFRNYFIVACEIIEPKNHKGELIALVGRMCGAIYVTGGGQTTATDRRVLLYERETGIAPRKQPERKRRADDPATLSLQAMHTRNQAFEGMPAHPVPMLMPTAPGMDPMFNKRPRYEAPDAQTLLRSADSFWSYHRALMESGEDIPYKTVPADQAYSSFAYPSHDLTYTTSHPQALSSHPSMHPSMRFLHDPLRRPQMPMSMQMQLPVGRSLPTPLPLPVNNASNGPKLGGTTGTGPGLGAGPPRGLGNPGGTSVGNGAGNANGSGVGNGSSANNSSRPGPSQLPIKGEPPKFQALQHAMSMPPPGPGPGAGPGAGPGSMYDYHPGSYGPPPPMHYGGYYGGPQPPSYQYPYQYQPPPIGVPQSAQPKSEEKYVPRVHPLSQYAPQTQSSQAQASSKPQLYQQQPSKPSALPQQQQQLQPPSAYGSQYSANGSFGYAGPSVSGFSGSMALPPQPSAQTRPQPLPIPQLKPLSQLSYPALTAQFPTQANTNTQSNAQFNSQLPYTHPYSLSPTRPPGLGGLSGASAMPAPMLGSPPQPQRAQAPYAPLPYPPSAQYNQPHSSAPAMTVAPGVPAVTATAAVSDVAESTKTSTSTSTVDTTSGSTDISSTTASANMSGVNETT